MRDARWILLMIVSTLLPAAVLADDEDFSIAENKTLPAEAIVIERLVTGTGDSSRWPLSFPSEAISYSNDAPPNINFLFQDIDTFKRVSRYRQLSLLTLAKSGQKRLFLGVNEEGLLGLHFRAVGQAGSERYLELLRMPYLQDSESERHTKKQ